MANYENAIGKQVITRTTDGEAYGGGKVIAYYDRPSFTIEKPDGSEFQWPACLCEVQEIYSFETSSMWDHSGYVVYAPDGKRIEPWDLIELLNARRNETRRERE